MMATDVTWAEIVVAIDEIVDQFWNAWNEWCTEVECWDTIENVAADAEFASWVAGGAKGV